MTDPGSRIPEAVGIKALGTEGLAALVAGLSEPSFRAGQLMSWLYEKAARSYDEMTNLPVRLRERLAEEAPLHFPTIVERQVSDDGTRKYLLELADGATIETVGLPTSDRLTVCFSTQAGCGMGCTFCATGAAGLTRSLGPGEMVDQLNVVASDFGARVTNAVAMGQGEPFADYDATLAALRIMNAPKGLGIGARHLTVSTCGLVRGICRFADEPEQFTLAVSLHSAVQSTRDTLMPGVRAYPLDALRDSLVDYAEKTGRRPSVEYTLIAGVNDTDAELKALVEYCRGLLIHVNLIPMNAVTDAGGHGSPAATVARFESALRSAGVEATVRAERGSDIAAACGQLRQRHLTDEPGRTTP